MQDRLTTYDANFHEGKEWIATVCESFLKDEKASKLILALNSGAFDRNKRGKAEIWYENKSWKLLIYDFKHEKGGKIDRNGAKNHAINNWNCYYNYGIQFF